MAARSPTIGRLLSSSRRRISNGTSHQSREVSTYAGVRAQGRAKSFLYGTGALVLVTGGYFYITDTRASVHRFVVPRVIRLLYPDAEDAHHFGTAALKELHTLGLHPRERGSSLDAQLGVEVFGSKLVNPVGISGGLDKGAEIPDALFAIGAGIVEIGGITPQPQVGNQKPRVFRLASQNAIINRYGLNSDGADVVAMRLRQRVRKYAYEHGYGIDETAEDIVLNGGAGVPPGSLVEGKLLAVQIAKNKNTPDDDLDAVVRDHVVCVEKLGRYADIITVNVSSPNTPGLRALQSQGPLTSILSAVVDAANATDRQIKPVVMVKISPDEDSDAQVRGICDAIWESGVAGVIVGNTTMKRPDPLPVGYQLPNKDAQAALEIGGYSGPQLFERTKKLVAKYRKALDEGLSPDISQPAKPAVTTKPQVQEKSKDPNAQVIKQVEASVARDLKELKPLDGEIASRPRTESSDENLPLIRLPERHQSSNTDNIEAGKAAGFQAITTQSAAVSTEPFTGKPSPKVLGGGKSQAFDSPSKVIFASGGIVNGEQALEVLNAGASVAMCYTGVVYGGVGTISRIKGEMQEKMKAGKVGK